MEHTAPLPIVPSAACFFAASVYNLNAIDPIFDSQNTIGNQAEGFIMGDKYGIGGYCMRGDHHVECPKCNANRQTRSA